MIVDQSFGLSSFLSSSSCSKRLASRVMMSSDSNNSPVVINQVADAALPASLLPRTIESPDEREHYGL